MMNLALSGQPPLRHFRLRWHQLTCTSPSALRVAVDELYDKLVEAGIEVLLADRRERPGVMFADLELIGIPHRIVLSERGLDAGNLEYKSRRTGESEDVNHDDAVTFLRQKLEAA